jgi:hypothetical protein
MGGEIPPGISLKHEIEGTSLKLDLRYDIEDWGNRLGENPPKVTLVEGETRAGYEIMWKRMAPGHFSLTHECPEGGVIRGSVSVGPYSLPFGPITVGTAAEWAFDPARLEELRDLSEATGGRELLDLEKAWVRPQKLQLSDLRIWLGSGVLFLLLLDALVTRMGWSLWRLPSRSTMAKWTGKMKSVPQVSSVNLAEPPQPEPIDAESRRARFERAKQRR